MAGKNDRGFDHLVLCVRDLDRACAMYRQLGFTVTPRAVHPFGTGNALVQFKGRSYLELLTVVDPARIPPAQPDAFSFGAYNQAFLARREGFSMLALQSGDAHGDCARLAKGGLATYPAFDFSRTATLADGSQAQVSFSLAFLAEPKSDDVALFLCQHHTPAQFWQPPYQTHPNGALGVVRVMMTAPEPEKLTDFFARLSVKAGTGGIAVSKAEALRLVGFRVAVADIQAVQRRLDDERIDYRQLDGVLQVALFATQIEFAAA
jgi:hypothetical protein